MKYFVKICMIIYSDIVLDMRLMPRHPDNGRYKTRATTQRQSQAAVWSRGPYIHQVVKKKKKKEGNLALPMIPSGTKA